MLICYRTRRRIGAYLDEALGDREAASAAAHIATCPRCQTELESFRRLATMLRNTMPTPDLPEWTGFWEGVRRGIEAPRVPATVRPRWRPRLVVGAAAASAALLLSVVLWQLPRLPFTSEAVAAISVNSADTDHPGGTVMIYSPPERDLAVVWVFAED